MSRGYFGIGVENIKWECNLGTLWRSAHSLGASFIFTIGRRYRVQSSDTSKAWHHVPYYSYGCFDDFQANRPNGCQLVGAELVESAHPLANFVHPERACYLLGAEDGGLSKNALKNCQCVVVLPGKHCLNVATAGSIIMYDRVSKGRFFDVAKRNS